MSSSCTLLPQAFPMRMSQLWLVTAVLLACVFSIVAYGTFRCRQNEFHDPLTQSVIEGEPWNRYLDGWGVLHFWFFALVTFYFPSCWPYILVAGVLWECVELMFKERPFYLAKCTAHNETKKNWWYGRWEDIVMNSLGMLCGLWLVHFQAPGKIIFPSGFVAILGGFVALQQIRKK